MAKKIGRPSNYNTDIATTICEAIADGKSVRTICDAKDMPDQKTVYRWLEKHEEFRQQYARARERQADLYASEIIEISDDGRRDYEIGDDGKEVVDHDHIARARLRVDARKWYASKLAPKKYGDKLTTEVSGPDGAPIDTKWTVEFVNAAPPCKSKA